MSGGGGGGGAKVLTLNWIQHFLSLGFTGVHAFKIMMHIRYAFHTLSIYLMRWIVWSVKCEIDVLATQHFNSNESNHSQFYKKKKNKKICKRNQSDRVEARPISQ